MAVFNIVVEIPERNDGIDDESYVYDSLRDITIVIEEAGYRYKLTTLS